MEALLKWWPVAVIVIQGLALWATWSMRQVSATAVHKANEESEARDQTLDDRIDALSERITAAVGRLDAVEAEVDQLPTKADLAVVAGDVKVVDAKIDTANRGIERLEGYFLTRGVGVSG